MSLGQSVKQFNKTTSCGITIATFLGLLKGIRAVNSSTIYLPLAHGSSQRDSKTTDLISPVDLDHEDESQRQPVHRHEDRSTASIYPPWIAKVSQPPLQGPQKTILH